MKLFTMQIEKASANCNTNIIIMGDVNLDSNKWDEPNFGNKSVSNSLRKVLDQNGFRSPVGNTYFADHAQKMEMLQPVQLIMYTIMQVCLSLDLQTLNCAVDSKYRVFN